MSDKGISIVGKPAIDLYRLNVLKSGVKMEAKGMKLTRGVNCCKVARQELGLPARAKHDEIIAAIDAEIARRVANGDAAGITSH